MAGRAAVIFELLSAFQRKNRFTGSSSDTDLSLLDSHLLGEIDGAPGEPVSRLVASLGVDAAMVSRALAALSKRKYIRVERPPSDRRRRLVHLSSRGRRALAVLDRNANGLLEAFTAGFEDGEVRDLSRLLLALADGMGAPPTCVREIDHPLRPGLRRVARALGLLADRQLDLPVSSSHAQVLRAIREEDGAATASTLIARLRIRQSTLSRIISELSKRRLVSQRKIKGDRRVSTLSVTEEGRALLAEVRASGARCVGEALARLASADADRLGELLEKLVYGGREEQTWTLENGASVTRIGEEDGRREARAFLVERLVEEGKHRSLGDALLPAGQSVVALHDGRRMTALCAFSHAGKAIALEHLVADQETARSWAYDAFVRLAFRTVLGESPGVKLFLTNDDRYVLPQYQLEWLSKAREGLSSGDVPFP